MTYSRFTFLLLLIVVLVGSCSFDKEKLKTSPSDRKSSLYPVSSDYNYTGVDSGQNNYTKRRK